MPAQALARFDDDIFITTADFGRIETLAYLRLDPDHPAVPVLAAKLEAAVLCRPEDIPGDVVTVNTGVRYRVDGDAAPTSCILVHPDQYVPTGQHVSLASPLGAALIGEREGARVSYSDDQGRGRMLTIEKVVCRAG